MIRQAIERIFSAYRKDDWADAKGFAIQLGAVLEKYPEYVIVQASDPRTGVQRTCKFPPSIAEIVSACEEALGPAQWREEIDRQRKERELRDAAMLEERRRFYGEGSTRSGGAATHSELCRKYGVRDIPWGLDAVDVVRLAHQHGIGLQAHFDSLNARPSADMARERAQAFLDNCANAVQDTEPRPVESVPF